MIKKAGILILLVLLLALFLPAGSVGAEGSINIQDSWAAADFPSSLSIGLTADSKYEINDIRLCYVVERTSFAEVVSEVYVQFAHSTAITVNWNLDLRMIGGLPPGSSIDYWWIVKDAGGGKVETKPARVQFDDNRYSWQTLSEGKVNIYWYKGDKAFAQELMAAAQEALERLDEGTGARLEKDAHIYIYSGSADVQGAMINPQEWTGGAAFTRYSTIVIGIAPSNLEWGKRAMSHELTHLVVHQVTLNPYCDIPTWLDEGLAMNYEGTPNSADTAYIEEARDEGKLLSVRSLASPFSADTETARLSYAQSYSLVKFLTDSYGRDRMLDLLQTFREGSTYDGALEKVYGFDMDGLDILWQEYIGVDTMMGTSCCQYHHIERLLSFQLQ